VRLNAADLTTILAILDKIDRGLINPHVPGHVGRYLRQYRNGRAQLDQLLVGRGVERRADAAISGRALDTIEVYPVLDLRVGLLAFPLGEVARTIAISEELGGLTNLVMWLKGGVANATYNFLRASPGVRLSGDYRWTPPSQLTPGEAQIEARAGPIRWQDARCLKVVADDLIRPPHALEYVLDHRIGPPGLKYFRCVCARRRGKEWEALPALASPRQLEVAGVLTKALSGVKSDELVALLIYREPWSQAWTIAGAQRIDADGAVDHAITWADFQRELDGCDTDGTIVAGIRGSLRASGLHAADAAEPNLTRQLLPLARDVLRWMRGSS
jgi:hypothetical protein